MLNKPFVEFIPCFRIEKDKTAPKPRDYRKFFSLIKKIEGTYWRDLKFFWVLFLTIANLRFF